VDWEKVGQAFQGGANVLAGGLMDRYQRGKDIEDWKRKTDYSADIEMRQRQAVQDLQTNEINHRAFLDMKKKEFETDPELFPVWQSAQVGNEKAREILETSTEFRHYVDSGIPLTAAQVERLIDQGTPIPPGVRSRILAGHLKASNEEVKRQADLTRTEAATTESVERGKYYKRREKEAALKPQEDVQYKRDSAGVKQLVTRFEYDLNKLAPEIAKLQAEISNSPYARAGIDSPELQATQSKLSALETKRDNIQKGRYATFKYEAELQEGKPLSEMSRAELNHVMNNPALVGTGEVFGGTEHFVLPGPAGPAPRIPTLPVESGALPPMPKEESYPVGTRRKNKRTGEIQVWDGTQWKPEK